MNDYNPKEVKRNAIPPISINTSNHLKVLQLACTRAQWIRIIQYRSWLRTPSLFNFTLFFIPYSLDHCTLKFSLPASILIIHRAAISDIALERKRLPKISAMCAMPALTQISTLVTL